jgi:hypothetical protein
MKGKQIEHKIGDKVSGPLEEKKVTLKVGTSTIVMEENQITLTSDTIATVGHHEPRSGQQGRYPSTQRARSRQRPAKKTFAKQA